MGSASPRNSTDLPLSGRSVAGFDGLIVVDDTGYDLGGVSLS